MKRYRSKLDGSIICTESTIIGGFWEEIPEPIEADEVIKENDDGELAKSDDSAEKTDDNPTEQTGIAKQKDTNKKKVSRKTTVTKK